MMMMMSKCITKLSAKFCHVSETRLFAFVLFQLADESETDAAANVSED